MVRNRMLKTTLPLIFCAALILAGCSGGDGGNTTTGSAVAPGGSGNVADGKSSLTDSASNSSENGNKETGDWYKPPVNVTWQWQLKGKVNTGYPVTLYDIDLFDSPEMLIDSIQSSGSRVVCYFSAGSYENWRPDAAEFSQADSGNTLEGWPGEKWLDIRSVNVRRIMQQRLDLAKQKGCDAVEPDNMDGYTNDSGFDLSAGDQLEFNRFIAGEAHKRGLSVGLKNDLDQVRQLITQFDFSVNEQCHEFDECDQLTPFIKAGKPVLNAEYGESLAKNAARRQSLCDTANSEDFSTLILPLELDDSFRFSCQ
jgi:hypothetical protein